MTNKDKEKDKLISKLVGELITKTKKKKKKHKKKKEKNIKQFKHIGHGTNQPYNPIATSFNTPGSSVPLTNKEDYSLVKTFVTSNKPSQIDNNPTDRKLLLNDLIKDYNESKALTTIKQPLRTDGASAAAVVLPTPPFKIKKKIVQGRKSKYSSPSKSELDKATLPILKEKCKELGIKVKGTKKVDYIRALYAFRDGESDSKNDDGGFEEPSTPNNTPMKYFTNPLHDDVKHMLPVRERIKNIEQRKYNTEVNNKEVVSASWQDPNEKLSSEIFNFESADSPKQNNLLSRAMETAKSMFSPVSSKTRSQQAKLSEIDKKLNKIDNDTMSRFNLKETSGFFSEP